MIPANAMNRHKRLFASAILALLMAGASTADDHPLALRSVGLQEFQAARVWMEGLRIGPGETHRLQFTIGAGALISVATTSDGDLSLALDDPSGNSSVTKAITSGREVAVSLHPVSANGLWSVELENTGAGVVMVSCEVVANAVIEAGGNDTMATAQDLNVAIRDAGAGTFQHVAATGIVGPGPDSEDWFRFSLANPVRVSPVIRGLNRRSVEIQLVNAAGSPQNNSEFTSLPAGDYFLQVTGDGARYGLGLVIGGWVWPTLSTDLEGSVLGYMPPALDPVQTSAFVADFGDDSSDEAAVADMIKSWSPEFIFTGGDNIYNSGNVGVGVGAWKTKVGDHYGEFIQARSDGSYPELTSPTQRFYPSVGNQDGTSVNPGGGSIAGYVDYFHSNPGGTPRLPTDGGAVHNAGESFYRVREGAVELFVLDTDHARQNAASMERQRDWIRAAVASSDAPWRFVIAHHPPYSSTKPNDGFPELRWLETLEADIIFSGDAHIYERLETDGPLALICGIGGKSLSIFNSGIPQSCFHFDDEYGALRIETTNDSVRIELRTIDDGANGTNGGRKIEDLFLYHALPFTEDAVFQLQPPLVALSLTPPLVSGEPNKLDPKLRLLRDSQLLQAEDDNSAPDGRNARLLFPAGFDGVGYLEITRRSDTGGPFEIIFLEPYDAWLFDLEVPPGTDTSPDADPDCDHLSNWFEYAIGGDPFQFSTPLKAGIDPNDPTKFNVTFPQREDHAERDIVYAIEVSNDLANWSPAPDGQKIGALSPGVEQWRTTLPVTDGATFTRMRATTSAP